MTRLSTAFKLLDRAGWDAARAAGRFEGSAVDLKDGYIHLSTAEQLSETARRHFADRRDLVLLTVDLTTLADTIRWEPSRGGDLFPHIHGPLPVSAVTGERLLTVAIDGEMIFEPAT